MMSLKQIAVVGLGASAVAGGVGTGIYLSQDKTTIKDKLNKSGIKLIKVNEEYQVAFKELKDTDSFIKDIKNDTNNILSTSSLTDGGNALKKWCEENLQKSLDTKNIEELLKKVKNYCGSRPLTIAEKLKKQNKKLTTKWKDKLTAIKGTDNNLQTDLHKIDNKITSLSQPSEDVVSSILEKWCNNNVLQKIVQDENDEIWKKILSRCL